MTFVDWDGWAHDAASHFAIKGNADASQEQISQIRPIRIGSQTMGYTLTELEDAQARWNVRFRLKPIVHLNPPNQALTPA